MSTWPAPITTLTLFADDIAEAKRFYREVFGARVMFEDDVSAAFDFGNTLVNVLASTEAPEVIEPVGVAPRDAGTRELITITVEDVDALAADLRTRGVELLNGPVDRPWGVRTAAFRDPGGHVWEIAQPLDATEGA